MDGAPGDQWQDALPIDKLPAGEVAEVVLAGRVVALANVAGQIHALDGICSHQGGSLGKGRLEGDCLTCPWHGWQYQVSTGRQLLSTTIHQRRFAVRLTGDTIQVCLDRPPTD